MSGESIILLRRLGVKSSKKGLFSTQLCYAPDGECGEDYVLCTVGTNGGNPCVLKLDEAGYFADNQKPGELLFAVLRTPFAFNMEISAGSDSDCYEWFFNLGGDLEIKKPEMFAAKLRGSANSTSSFDSTAFSRKLGTIPATVLHDKVVAEVLGKMSLREMHFTDIRESLEDWRTANEAFVTSAINEAFENFFGADGVVEFKVSEFRTQSPDCEEADKQNREFDDRQRELDGQQENLKRREDKLATERADLNSDMAKLEKQLKELMSREETLKSQQFDMAGQKSALESQIATLSDQKRDLERQKSDMTTRQQKLDDFQESLKAEGGRLDSDRKALAAEKANLADERERLKAERNELELQKKNFLTGDTLAATAALEVIANMCGAAVSKARVNPFAELLNDAGKKASSLRLLALVNGKKKKDAGGVTLEKNAPSFQDRGGMFVTKKTLVLHEGESLSSCVTCNRDGGYLTVLNISECDEIIPMAPNCDFPDAIRIARGEQVHLGDGECEYLSELYEGASKGTDNYIAIVSNAPLLSSHLPQLGDPLPPDEAAELVSKLEDLGEDEWSADVMSFTILPKKEH